MELPLVSDREQLQLDKKNLELEAEKRMASERDLINAWNVSAF